MPITASDADEQDQHPEDRNIDFTFLPEVLVDKCKPFIIRYHELNGLSCLPNILWHPETRKFIEANLPLRQLFKKSTSARLAQKANEGFVLIAALILSTEILAIGLAGWARRYPAAHKKAQALFDDYAPSSRARLTERYLFSPNDRSRTAVDALARPDLMMADQERKFLSGLTENFEQSSPGNDTKSRSFAPASERFAALHNRATTARRATHQLDFDGETASRSKR